MTEEKKPLDKKALLEEEEKKKLDKLKPLGKFGKSKPLGPDDFPACYKPQGGLAPEDKGGELPGGENFVPGLDDMPAGMDWKPQGSHITHVSVTHSLIVIQAEGTEFHIKPEDLVAGKQYLPAIPMASQAITLTEDQVLDIQETWAEWCFENEE